MSPLHVHNLAIDGIPVYALILQRILLMCKYHMRRSHVVIVFDPDVSFTPYDISNFIDRISVINLFFEERILDAGTYLPSDTFTFSQSLEA